MKEKIVGMLSFENFVSKAEEVEETVTFETIYEQRKQNYCDFM